MKLHDLLGVLATVCYLAPLVLILFLGLFINKSLLSLALYCAIAVVHNALNTGLLAAHPQMLHNSGILFGYLNSPLMLGLLTLYCHTPVKKKALYSTATLYIIYEAFIAVLFGWQEKSVLYTSGVGLMLVFGLGIYFFTAQLKQTVRFGKGLGRSFIAAAIFFSYGLYGIVYYVHCIHRAPEVADTMALYYTASIIFCVLVSTGLLHLYLRHRQIRQVQQVRRELQAFFAE